jgi:hypothetical protein
MRPGQVTSDTQAFQQILGRLVNEVGTGLQLIDIGKREKGLYKDTAPFWSLVRQMLPIAESIGDLIYRGNSTVKNLTSVLATEFEAERPGYNGKAATLAILYRHSLTHQDELQALQTGGKEVAWQVSYGDPSSHLKLVKVNPTCAIICFDTTAFFQDLVKVCQTAQGKAWGGEVMKRYNGWLTYDLDAEAKDKNVTAAIAEIGKLF